MWLFRSRRPTPSGKARRQEPGYDRPERQQTEVAPRHALAGFEHPSQAGGQRGAGQDFGETLQRTREPGEREDDAAQQQKEQVDPRPIGSGQGRLRAQVPAIRSPRAEKAAVPTTSSTTT